MNNVTKILVKCVIAVILVSIGAAIGGSVNIRWNNDFSISSAELVTVILAAIAVMFTILSVFLAVFGFLGWTSINEKIRDYSINHIGEQLKEGQPMSNLIQQAVTNAIYRGIESFETDEEFDDDNGQKSEA